MHSRGPLAFERPLQIVYSIHFCEILSKICGGIWVVPPKNAKIPKFCGTVERPRQ